MKTLLFVIFLFFGAAFGRGEGVPQGAIDYFAKIYGHKHPATLQIIPVHFKGTSNQYLMSFAQGDWRGPEAVWGLVESVDGRWKEPKLIDVDGQTKDFSALSFDPASAGFVYLPSYNCYGLLDKWKKSWSFTYFIGDAIDTLDMWSPDEVGLTEEGLQQLLDANKVKVQQVTVK